MHYKTAGNDVVSEEEGIVALQLPESKKLVLQDFTYLPSALANLLSLGTLQQKGWTFDFANGYGSWIAPYSHVQRRPQRETAKGKAARYLLAAGYARSRGGTTRLAFHLCSHARKGYTRQLTPSDGAHRCLYDQGTC